MRSCRGLKELGWIESGNLRIIRRWTEGDPERSREYAAELVGLGLDAILTTGSAGLIPLLQVTRTTPIVFTIVRSCRRRVHQEPGPARWQRHRVRPIRIRINSKM